mgnify:FL=1
MSAIINNSFRKYQADNFIASISSNSVYLAIGKNDPWSGNSRGEYADGTFSDTVLPAPPLDTNIASSKHWDDFIALKRINSSSVSHVIKRVNWISGTVYDAYDDVQDHLIDKNFFVFDDVTFNVYKCIDNNGGGVSTNKPTGTGTSINGRTIDGYVWKFMFQVKQPDVLKYVTTDWIPVKSPAGDSEPEQKAVEDAAIDGKLQHIKITNGGSSYLIEIGTVSASSSTTVTLGAGASSINDTYKDMDIFIDTGLGNTQLRRITAYDGTTKLATISTAWTTLPTPAGSSTYVVAPAVVILPVGSSNGTGGTARVKTVTGGVIKDVVMVEGGQGYRVASASIVVALNGVNATILPVLSPLGGHGNDAVSELGGAFVMMNTRLTGTENSDFPVNDDFRKVHVVVNPRVIASGNAIATETTYQQIPTPELKKNTGQILYTEFRVPINRAADSTEDIKLVVEF